MQGVGLKTFVDAPEVEEGEQEEPHEAFHGRVKGRGGVAAVHYVHGCNDPVYNGRLFLPVLLACRGQFF